MSVSSIWAIGASTPGEPEMLPFTIPLETDQEPFPIRDSQSLISLSSKSSWKVIARAARGSRKTVRMKIY